MSDLDGYNDRDLVEELENRGYTVDEINLDKITLNYGDRDQILNLIDVSSPKIGSPLYFLHEKLRGRDS